MNFKVKIILLLFVLAAGLLYSANPVVAREYALPLRLIAIAEVAQIRYASYSVHEFLEIYNDDFNKPLVVKSVHADTWVGHQKDRQNINWLENDQEIVIPPDTVRRVAERKRVVHGRPKQNWWVRWLRFKVTTNRGVFYSNYVASPFKPPIYDSTVIKDPYIDSLTEPATLTPFQKNIR